MELKTTCEKCLFEIDCTKGECKRLRWDNGSWEQVVCSNCYDNLKLHE